MRWTSGGSKSRETADILKNKKKEGGLELFFAVVDDSLTLTTYS